ncbi:MAG TPA: ATP-binding protein [Steroidobacteraceae bacterium]|nr:ATP-binding protein [Steroidobacteraceae bacterium]
MTQLTTSVDSGLDFLAGGGSMGERIRAYSWADNSLGDPQCWPQALRTTVRILLTTGHPTMIFWGSQLTCLYNDAFSRSLGPEKHPAILGAAGRHAWEEVWPIVGGQIEQVLRGDGAVWLENQCVPIIRHGALQEVYWTYSYSPIDDPDSPHGVGGVLVTCSETTEQVLAERKLKSEREKFVRLFDQAPSFLALLRGPDHVIELANPAYLALTDYRPVMGLRVVDAFPEAVTQGYLALLDEVYRTGKPYSASAAKYMFQTTPGGQMQERHIDFVYQPITDGDSSVVGILVQGVDVSSRLVTDRVLALSRARLDYATRLSGIGFWYCDLPFDELQWDDRVKEHFFFAPTDRITIDDFYARIHVEDRELTRNAIQTSIINKAPYDIDYRTVCPTTGEIKWIRALGGTDYAADGTPKHFDGVTVDVSAQKMDQQRLAQLNRQLREEDRRKDEFIATLSHELRNPLAPIRAAAKVIASPEVTATQLKRAHLIIERQMTHMTLLLDDLFDIARITQGKLKIRKELLPLADVVDTAVEAVRPKLESKNQQLSLSLPTEPVFLEADHLRLSQVVSNLLTNAAKYSAQGSSIDLTCTLHTNTLSLSVKDNGIGIAAESIASIFEMFSQIDDATGRSEGGLGIGLALVKGLTELHGGTVEVRSRGLGYGSEFILRLPCVAQKMATAQTPNDSVSVSNVRRRVLVVDDNRDAADSISMLLELAGHEVKTANLGRVALSLAQTFQPDTAVLDIGMPDLSGYEVAEQLRLEPWASEIQLIALTGWGQDNDRRLALEARFDHHLVKPVDADQLTRLIAKGSSAKP